MTDTDPGATTDIVVPLENVDLEPGTNINDEKTDRAGTNIALETKVPPENNSESRCDSQADDSKDNLAGDVEEKETADTTNWRQRTITWIREKEPAVKEGLRKTKVNIGEKWGVVSEFTKQEAQLIGSQVKWAYYCRKNGRTDESKFVDTFYLVNDWKVSLKAQKKALQKLIKYQRDFESDQEHLIAALRKVPDSSECGNSSTRLGTMIEQKKRNLVSTINLEKILSQINDLLQNEYVSMQFLKKKYDTAKNNVDVCKKKIETKGESELLKNDLELLSEEYDGWKESIMQLSEVILSKQNTTLVSAFVQASENKNESAAGF